MLIPSQYFFANLLRKMCSRQVVSPWISHPDTGLLPKLRAEIETIGVPSGVTCHAIRAARKRHICRGTLPGLIIAEGAPVETNGVIDGLEKTMRIGRLEMDRSLRSV